MIKPLALFGVLAITGCASTPYAIIDGTQSQVSDRNNYDVKILSVDGKMLPKEDIENVSPGFHYFNLVTTKPLKTRAKDADYKMLAIDVKECTRYLITAQHDNSVRDEWEPKILREEPIESCTPGKQSEQAAAPLPDYLSPATEPLCQDVSALTNQNSPVDLYPAIKQCVIEGKEQLAIYHYFHASAYGYYDAARVYDSSSHEALAVIQKHSTWKLAPTVQDQFEAALMAFIQTPENLAEACSFVRDLGKPAYSPGYMVAHGVRKLDENSENGLKKSFDEDLNWQTVLSQQLHCPA